MNLVANGFGLKKGDKVLTSDKEHNSNVVPWHHLAKYKGINYQVVPAKDNYYFDLEVLKESIDSKTKLMSVIHTSNLDGHTNPVKDIIEICHDKGIKVLMDAAQAAPHKELATSQRCRWQKPATRSSMTSVKCTALTSMSGRATWSRHSMASTGAWKIKF